MKLLSEDSFAHRAADWDQPEKIKMAEKFVEAVLQHIEPLPQWRALEIGAGTGLVGLLLLPHIASLVCVDSSEAMLEVLRNKTTGKNNIEIVHGETTDYTKHDIDFVFSNMSFHHIPDIPALLQHLHSITRAGASIVVGDIRTEDGSFHRFEPIPHRGFDPEQLRKQFETAGFEVEQIRTYRALHRERVPGTISSYEQFILIARKA